MNNKIKCSECDNIAQWCYLPNCNDETLKGFYCDKCVPRGCTCNLYDFETCGEPDKENVVFYDKNTTDFNEKTYYRNKKDTSFYYEYLDENGKRFPCCEYDYSEDGFEK